MAYKPDGYSSVSVYLVAKDAQKLIDFLKATFGATETRRFDQPDGSIMHAEVKIEDSIIMISDSGEGYPPFPVWIHVYVANVDSVYQKALAAGGESVQVPVHKEGDPDKRGGVKGPSGNTWWISTQQI